MAVTTKGGSEGDRMDASVTPKPRKSAPDRPGGGVGIFRFLGETFGELSKVVWPTPQELIRYTFVVLVTLVVLGLVIFGLDTVLHALVGRFVYGNQVGA